MIEIVFGAYYWFTNLSDYFEGRVRFLNVVFWYYTSINFACQQLNIFQISFNTALYNSRRMSYFIYATVTDLNVTIFVFDVSLQFNFTIFRLWASISDNYTASNDKGTMQVLVLVHTAR